MKIPPSAPPPAGLSVYTPAQLESHASSVASEYATEEEQAPTFQNFLSVLREQMHIWIIGLIIGLLFGFVIYLTTPRTFQAKGTFLVDQLPFQGASENATDSETVHEMVQSLILSIPGREMKRAVAQDLHVLPSALSFNDKEPKISLSGDRHRANIKVAATRSSRLGTITVESCDPEFATQVVDDIFKQILTMNTLAGRLATVQSQLLLSRGSSAKLIENLVAITGEGVKLKEEVIALDKYQKVKNQPLAEFSAINNDLTIINLKTQLLLVEAEYEALASYSIRGLKYEGKRAELKGLQDELTRQASHLAQGLLISRDINQTQEDDLTKAVKESEKKGSAYQTERGRLARAFSDLDLRKKILATPLQEDEVESEASVIAVVDPGIADQKPVRPNLFLNLFLGSFLGLAGGAALAFTIHLLDSRLRTPIQIQLSTGLPCIATLHAVSDRVRTFTDAPSDLGFLRGQLLRESFTSGHHPIFAFSRVGTGGDSMEALAELAILLAKSEKKTLVINLNFSDNRLAKRLGIKPTSGLTDWLFSADPLEEHIAFSAVQELAMIDAGEFDGDVDSLISCRPLAPELTRLGEKWDFILIDGPPLLEAWHLLLAAPPSTQLIVVSAYQGSTTSDLLRFAARAATAQMGIYGVILQDCPERQPVEEWLLHTKEFVSELEKKPFMQKVKRYIPFLKKGK